MPPRCAVLSSRMVWYMRCGTELACVLSKRMVRYMRCGTELVYGAATINRQRAPPRVLRHRPRKRTGLTP
eukprot:1085648-Rhodomonas_salina.1